MRKPLAETVSKENLRNWLINIFMHCDSWDIEEALGHEFDDDDDEEAVAEYAADHYIDDLYPAIFDHFEFKPFMSGHDEDEEFFEHEYLFGDVIELDSTEWEHAFDGNTEYDRSEVFYLVDNGEIADCMSFHFKSRTVEFTHEYELTNTDIWLDAFSVCEVFNSIIEIARRKSDGKKSE